MANILNERNQQAIKDNEEQIRLLETQMSEERTRAAQELKDIADRYSKVNEPYLLGPNGILKGYPLLRIFLRNITIIPRILDILPLRAATRAIRNDELARSQNTAKAAMSILESRLSDLRTSAFVPNFTNEKFHDRATYIVPSSVMAVWRRNVVGSANQAFGDKMIETLKLLNVTMDRKNGLDTNFARQSLYEALNTGKNLGKDTASKIEFGAVSPKILEAVFTHIAERAATYEERTGMRPNLNNPGFRQDLHEAFVDYLARAQVGEPGFIMPAGAFKLTETGRLGSNNPYETSDLAREVTARAAALTNKQMMSQEAGKVAEEAEKAKEAKESSKVSELEARLAKAEAALAAKSNPQDASEAPSKGGSFRDAGTEQGGASKGAVNATSGGLDPNLAALLATQTQAMVAMSRGNNPLTTGLTVSGAMTFESLSVSYANLTAEAKNSPLGQALERKMINMLEGVEPATKAAVNASATPLTALEKAQAREDAAHKALNDAKAELASVNTKITEMGVAAVPEVPAAGGKAAVPGVGGKAGILLNAQNALKAAYEQVIKDGGWGTSPVVSAKLQSSLDIYEEAQRKFNNLESELINLKAQKAALDTANTGRVATLQAAYDLEVRKVDALAKDAPPKDAPAYSGGVNQALNDLAKNNSGAKLESANPVEAAKTAIKLSVLVNSSPAVDAEQKLAARIIMERALNALTPEEVVETLKAFNKGVIVANNTLTKSAVLALINSPDTTKGMEAAQVDSLNKALNRSVTSLLPDAKVDIRTGVTTPSIDSINTINVAACRKAILDPKVLTDGDRLDAVNKAAVAGGAVVLEASEKTTVEARDAIIKDAKAAEVSKKAAADSLEDAKLEMELFRKEAGDILEDIASVKDKLDRLLKKSLTVSELIDVRKTLQNVVDRDQLNVRTSLLPIAADTGLAEDKHDNAVKIHIDLLLREPGKIYPAGAYNSGNVKAEVKNQCKSFAATSLVDELHLDSKGKARASVAKLSNADVIVLLGDASFTGKDAMLKLLSISQMENLLENDKSPLNPAQKAELTTKLSNSYSVQAEYLANGHNANKDAAQELFDKTDPDKAKVKGPNVRRYTHGKIAEDDSFIKITSGDDLKKLEKGSVSVRNATKAELENVIGKIEDKGDTLKNVATGKASDKGISFP